MFVLTLFGKQHVVGNDTRWQFAVYKPRHIHRRETSLHTSIKFQHMYIETYSRTRFHFWTAALETLLFPRGIDQLAD